MVFGVGARRQHTPGTLEWPLGFVVGGARCARRARLRPSTPEMLAALSMLAAGWRDDNSAAAAINLAERSREPEVRAKVAAKRTGSSNGAAQA